MAVAEIEPWKAQHREGSASSNSVVISSEVDDDNDNDDDDDDEGEGEVVYEGETSEEGEVATEGEGENSGEGAEESELYLVDLAFSGCQPRFDGGTRYVQNNNVSVVIGSVDTGIIVGSIQLDIYDGVGFAELSTQHRIDTETVINVMDSGNVTYSNITQDDDYYTGDAPDTISGSMYVNHYDEAGGVIDIDFNNVILESVYGGSFCTMDGSLITMGTGYEYE